MGPCKTSRSLPFASVGPNLKTAVGQPTGSSNLSSSAVASSSYRGSETLLAVMNDHAGRPGHFQSEAHPSRGREARRPSRRCSGASASHALGRHVPLGHRRHRLQPREPRTSLLPPHGAWSEDAAEPQPRSREPRWQSAAVRAAGKLPPTADSYIEEAVETHNTACSKAAAVMVGAASKTLLLALRDAIVARLGTLGRKPPSAVGAHPRCVLRAPDRSGSMMAEGPRGQRPPPSPSRTGPDRRGRRRGELGGGSPSPTRASTGRRTSGPSTASWPSVTRSDRCPRCLSLCGTAASSGGSPTMPSWTSTRSATACRTDSCARRSRSSWAMTTSRSSWARASSGPRCVAPMVARARRATRACSTRASGSRSGSASSSPSADRLPRSARVPRQATRVGHAARHVRPRRLRRRSVARRSPHPAAEPRTRPHHRPGLTRGIRTTPRVILPNTLI